MAEWTEQELENVIDDVMRRSMVDEDFRSLVVRDPLAAITKLNPKPLPEEFRPQFVDNSGTARTFILPDPIPMTGELLDEELEQVAGGWCVCTNCCCTNCCVSCDVTNCSTTIAA